VPAASGVPRHGVADVTIRNFVIFAADPERRRVVKDLAELKLDMSNARDVRILP